MRRISKTSHVRFVVCTILALTAALVPLHAAHAAAITERGKALVKLDDDWSKLAGGKDAAKVASFYAEDAMVLPPNEPVAMGRAAAEKVWASYFAAPNFSISWKTTAADIAKSGDLGYTAGTYEDSYDGPDGKRVQETGKYLCTWRKQKDGSWKALFDMWNSDSK